MLHGQRGGTGVLVQPDTGDIYKNVCVREILNMCFKT